MVKCRHWGLGYGNNIEIHNGNQSSMTANNQMIRETFGTCETKKKNVQEVHVYICVPEVHVSPQPSKHQYTSMGMPRCKTSG